MTNLRTIKTSVEDLDLTRLKVAKVTLTSAQVLALNTTPVTLVAAPWAGLFIDVVSVSWKVDYNSAAYATNTTLEVRYTNGSGSKVTADLAALITATADKTVTVKGVTTELVNIANAPVIVRAATGNPATGNSPVTIEVTYRVLKAL